MAGKRLDVWAEGRTLGLHPAPKQRATELCRT